MERLEIIEDPTVSVCIDLPAPVVSLGEAIVVPNGNPKSTFTGVLQRWGDVLVAIKTTSRGVRIPRYVTPDEVVAMVERGTE